MLPVQSEFITLESELENRVRAYTVDDKVENQSSL